MRKTDFATVVILIFGVFVFAPPAATKIIYVDDDILGGNGTSWVMAFKDLQDALWYAYSGDEIRVAEGIYYPDQGAGVTPDDPASAFELITGVAIYGGYAGSGEPNPDERDIALYQTILSGDIGTEGDTSDNSYHVVTGDGCDTSALLDGFTIIAGNAAGFYSGGGMYNNFGSPMVANCIFKGNSADWYGGAMYNNSSDPIVTNCIFYKNTADWYGGAMYNDSSDPTLIDCIFIDNATETEYQGQGGGMYNYQSNPTLTNCIFSGNIAADGAGMHNRSSSLVLTNCIFSGNTANWGGGGIAGIDDSVSTVTNCIFNGNLVNYSGGGGIESYDSRFILINCTRYLSSKNTFSVITKNAWLS